MSDGRTPPRRFRYRAVTPEGRIVRGWMYAGDDDEVGRRLSGEGLAALTVKGLPERALSPRMRRNDLAAVFRNVSTLVGSGVPVERAIAASEGLVGPRVAETLAELRRLVREGASVADALDAMPNVFPRSLAGVVRAGERGSALAAACETVATQFEADAALGAQIRSALAYPVLILFMGIATIVVMATVVVPRFATILTDLGTQLPPSTQALLTASDLMRHLAVPLLLAAVLTIPVARTWAARPEIRSRLDRLLLETPLVGRLRHGFASARTCRALGAMLTNGMPLLAALDASVDATGDLEVARRIAHARSAVARGTSLTEALRSEAALTPVALQLVGVGESSSRLGMMVARAGDVAADQAERALRTTVALIEPLLVIGLGIVVAAAAAALLQAVYSVRLT